MPYLDDEWEATSKEAEPRSADAQQNETTNNPENGSNSQASVNFISGTDTANTTASESRTVSDSENRKPLSPAERARLNSLKTMLNASNARYQQATKNRSPIFAAGLEVRVTRGDHAGKIGVVLDADYIENRALISLPNQESPHWIGFKSLGHTD